MILEVNDDRIRVTLRGHTWITGEKAPKIAGWTPKWVSHFGTDRTEITYAKETPCS